MYNTTVRFDNQGDSHVLKMYIQMESLSLCSFEQEDENYYKDRCPEGSD